MKYNYYLLFTLDRRRQMRYTKIGRTESSVFSKQIHSKSMKIIFNFEQLLFWYLCYFQSMKKKTIFEPLFNEFIDKLFLTKINKNTKYNFSFRFVDFVFLLFFLQFINTHTHIKRMKLSLECIYITQSNECNRVLWVCTCKFDRIFGMKCSLLFFFSV